jgi:integrase
MAKKRRRGPGEGTIRQKPSGRWVGRFWGETHDGRRVRRYVFGDSRKEVAAKLTQALAERDKAGGVLNDDNLTVADLLDRFLAASKATVKPSTFAQYQRTAEARIKPALGHVRLNKLNPGHLEVVYQSWLDAGASPSTVRGSHAIIHASLGRAVRWGLVQRNVADLVSAPKVRPPEIRPLSAEEGKRLLAAASDTGDQLEALWVLLLTSGLRIGEALATRWEDIDLGTGTLRVARTLAWRTGIGPTFGPPKSGKGRSIRLTDRAVEDLRRHRVRQNEQRLKALVWVEHGLVFTSTIGTPLARNNVHERHFKPLLERAGLSPKDVTPHTLRHTCATLLLQQGTHPTLVQHLLGHSTVAMTLDRYSHWVPSMGAATATAMDAALGL